ncbi:cytochrome P450 monooxygenase, partial [Phakopsora pachyrhizi]
VSRLPGPNSPSFFVGNFLELIRSESGSLHMKWFKEYGTVFKFHFLFGEPRIATIDPKALNHVLVKNSYDYPKPDAVRKDMTKILGHGLVLVEGDVHKRQRKLLNPTFSPGQLRALTPVIFKIANLLSSKWNELLIEKDDKSRECVLIDVLPWLNRAALDIIGLAGFGHNFESLDHFGKSELANAFYAVTNTELKFSKLGALRIFLINILKKLAISHNVLGGERSKAIANNMNVMERESKKILAVAQSHADDQETSKDLISLLVRANKAEKGAGDKMDDDEVVGQMTTFLFAGHETSASALTWQLWMLAKHPKVQNKLREELFDAIRHRDAPAETEGVPLSMDELLSLTYLDAFVREVMRLYPPVWSTIRVASHDDQIPLSNPVRTKTGELVDCLNISAGQAITIPIYAFNRSREVFGESCLAFDPERWLQENKRSSGIGVWAGLLSFLAGPRSCIGYRFALIEMKAILLVLLTKFKFEERDEGGGPDFEKRGFMLMKPKLKGADQEAGVSMPLRVSLVESY